MHRDPDSPRPRRTVLATAGLTASASVIAAALLGGQLPEREPGAGRPAVALPFADADTSADAEPAGEHGGRSEDEA